MKKLVLILLFILSNSILFYAQPIIEWQKALGGSGTDVAFSIQQTADSGYIVAGYASSADSDITVYHGNSDLWVVKLDGIGSIQWEKSFGGTDLDVATDIQQTTDGGYIACGYSRSNDFDLTGNRGQEDYWIIKLSSTGILQWQKSFGGTNVDRANSIEEVSGGGYIVAGLSKSDDGDVTGHHGLPLNIQYDYWIVRLDSAGTLLWEKSLGGSSSDVGFSIQQTTDGGFVVAGAANSNDGDVTGLHGTPANADCWVVKLNSSGVIEWENALGGTENDFAYDIQQTSDGGYIVGGNSASSDGDVSIHWGSFVDNDIWIFKLDSTGALSWEKTFGGTSTDYTNFVQQTSDGGYVIAGYTASNDGDLTGLHGLTIDYDFWIIKLNSTGAMEWQDLYGGTRDDVARCIRQLPDEGFIVAGSTASSNGDVTGNNGGIDMWVVKLGQVNIVNEIHSPISNIQSNPNPFSNETIISFQLSTSDNVKVEIHDVESRLIKNLSNNILRKGVNEVRWDATDNSGNKVSDGVYFINIVSGNKNESKKVILLRN